MKEIRMVDLKCQYEKIKDEINFSIQNVIDNTSFIKGPEVNLFKQDLEKYLKVKHVIPCANGTDAIQIALMSLGLKPGDEVITSDFTFIATVEAIALLGLIPVLVDVKPDTFNIDPIAVEKAITSKTKAIIPVHLFGQCADMEAILNIAEKYSLKIIEDTAQAIGSKYFFNNNTNQFAGTIGDISCVSFFPSKNLGCFGDGGAIFTNNDEYAEIINSIVNHGMKKRYYHDRIGVNSRLDTIQAAILRIKLKYLDSYNKARIKAANYYDEIFYNSESLKIPFRSNFSIHIFHQYTLITKNIDRNKLQEFLKSEGIPSMIYYPVPLHKQKCYKSENYKSGDFPVTEKLCESVISLPMHTELDNEQLEYITSKVLSFINK
ncbi:MAG: DegT/DnrJ/EryC1/StrS family aminotransferase [Bacteroidales bacterium]|nr:DegT/DnrJ/EryC1/StrS family aminotransferase [Bacteroidales bacterium]